MRPLDHTLPISMGRSFLFVKRSKITDNNKQDADSDGNIW